MFLVFPFFDGQLREKLQRLMLNSMPDPVYCATKILNTPPKKRLLIINEPKVTGTLLFERSMGQ